MGQSTSPGVNNLPTKASTIPRVMILNKLVAASGSFNVKVAIDHWINRAKVVERKTAQLKVFKEYSPQQSRTQQKALRPVRLMR